MVGITWLDILGIALLLFAVYLILTTIFGNSATPIEVTLSLFLGLGSLFGSQLYKMNRELGEIKVGLKHSFHKVKLEMGNIKSEIGDIKLEMGNIKSEIGDIKLEMGNIKPEIGNIKLEMESIKWGINNLSASLGAGAWAGKKKQAYRKAYPVQSSA